MWFAHGKHYHYPFDEGKMYVVILAAGSGTRIRPLSYYLPKVLLPVKGKPVLDYLLSNVESLHPDEVYIVASEHTNTIENYLEKTGMTGVKVVRGLGWETGGDLALALEQIDKIDDVVVMNGDIVTDIDMSEVYEFHLKQDALVTASVFEMDDKVEARRFGRVQLDPSGKILNFHEKSDESPDNRSIVNTGFYIFSSKLLKDKRAYLPPKVSKLELDLFPALSSAGRMFGHLTKLNYWWDVGTLDSYIRAENFMINRHGVNPP